MDVNTVLEGDCLDVMKDLPDNCIDTIITDPPYALTNRTPDVMRCISCKRVLGGRDGKCPRCPRCGGKLSNQRTQQQRGFMGKEWDNGSIAFNTEVWREALRVAKPGATLMAFGGTRTYHRLACAIEDAGWEIRDCITYFHDGSQQEAAFMASLNDEQLAAYLEMRYPNMQTHWVYGSGFPKSTSVSKQLDRQEYNKREKRVKEELAKLGYTNIQWVDKMQVAETIVLNIDGQEIKVNRLKDGTFEKPDYLKRVDRQKWPTIPMITSSEVGTISKNNRCGICMKPLVSGSPCQCDRTTAPTTPLAKQFSGYGTALKPAFEPIVVAQKPIEQNYAHNAEKWGVAGLNIDGGRIGTEEITTLGGGGKCGNSLGWSGKDGRKIPTERIVQNTKHIGRWPANVIRDDSEEVEAEFAKVGVRTSGKILPHHQCRGWSSENSHPGYKSECHTQVGGFESIGDSGSVSRFFYCAKSSSAERGDYNNHPTVKPLELVKYLCRLTRTPTGGLVLDPFAGSGTTALAAIAEGRDYILIEKESDYVEVCKRRIAEYTGQEIAPKEIEISEDKSAKQMPLW